MGRATQPLCSVYKPRHNEPDLGFHTSRRHGPALRPVSVPAFHCWDSVGPVWNAKSFRNPLCRIVGLGHRWVLICGFDGLGPGGGIGLVPVVGSSIVLLMMDLHLF
ncbi:hypothetical protein SKAU_G00170460 [Synaphobranchus kaupii]|uniref:Uncharacterized protein n=1 Tax=Synaphobranchus kaupii TaxID=118154 RepID=A0A9Q1FKF9_SYNKA|nr:hypothetical protein SKAU_G00170460 [Synaphobranchus kaupii]